MPASLSRIGLAFLLSTAVSQQPASSAMRQFAGADGTLVYAVRPIPEGVAVRGHHAKATQYGYRIPSLLTTVNGTVLAFAERRIGLHDHAQNDIVVKRSANGGRTWGHELVVHEDGMHSINDPLTVQLRDGRILMMFARFPYGRHARNSGWIKMAEPGYEDLTKNVLTFVTASDDDGRTWSEPRDISRQVKPAHWINANSPGAMVQLRQGPHAGRLITALWGTVPPADGSNNRTWEVVAAYSDDGGTTWNRTEPLRDPEKGHPNECQIAQAANNDLILIARNQGGAKLRKKAISRDGGVTWSVIATDQTLPSVACMGSIVRGPTRSDGSWQLLATFPSEQGRKDGRIAISQDFGRSFEIRGIVSGSFGYSATQIAPDGKSLLCLYETKGVKEMRLLSIPLAQFERQQQPRRPNVLFIACDDMNDWVGFLGGHPDTLTPNMDRLASRGMVFTRAYCASPICGPSRAAVLTGFAPRTSGVYTNQGTYIDYVPTAVSLPRFFRNNGYTVMGAGKINHAMGCVVPDNYDEYGPDAGAIGGPFTWEELNMNPGQPVARDDIAARSDTGPSGIIENIYPGKKIARGDLAATLPLNGIDNRIDRPANGYNTFDWGPVSVDDDAMPDGKVAAWAERKLAAHYTSPFFLAAGFYRPHQPWYVPTKYLGPFEGRRLALPPTIERDLDDCGEAARQYAHYPWAGSFATVRRHEQWQDAIRGYLAAIHFTDAQVGRVVKALDASPYRDDTLIVLWSDHGWQLGEKEHWGKHSPWEGSMRVPLIIVPPRSMAIDAGRTDALTSLLDLYPTLADMCGLEPPQELDGLSLRPIVERRATHVRDHIVTTLGRSTFCIRQGDLKLIRYYDGTEELYDLGADPHEFWNLIDDPAYATQATQLRLLAPVDARFKHFLRHGRYKAVIDTDDNLALYDMLHERSGIGEHAEVSERYPEIVTRIRDYLHNSVTAQRYSNLPVRRK